ncbi:MAG: nucleotidyltransferase domain-containing protein [Geobacteraceae bacterium]|nr:nucleotidyltransferase domain-containing protein [Geobacteraceae bacterium]NTW79107.1 nucleotidyltransferase domain-containing protein [Geobacteraceae bacterium]
MPSRTVKNISPEALKQFHPFKMNPGIGAISTVRQESAKDTANALAKVLKERFHASKVMLFGSVTRTDFSQWSDIDLAVWGISISDYYKAVAYVSGYSSVFKVDLVDAEDCSQSLRQHIIQNGIEL